MQNVVVLAVATLATSHVCLPDGLDSQGNTDAVITWTLGRLAPGESVRHAVLLACDESYDALASRLEAARERLAKSLPPSTGKAEQTREVPVWIQNDATDFALEGSGFFRWRMQRQALKCSQGGQLSQFTWYVHYRDGAGKHRAGTPNDGDSSPENLEVTQPVQRVSDTELALALRTSDGKLGIRVRGTVGPGSQVCVEFVLTNLGKGPLEDVRLSTYANFEAAHTYDYDLSYLDRTIEGAFALDPETGMCVGMAGLGPPASGHSGTWNSQKKAQTAAGVAFGEWTAFPGLSDKMKARIARMGSRAGAPPGIYLPYIHDDPTTPETRTLTPEEARAALERDWLFQAMGRPLTKRALLEIGWARELAARLAQVARPAALSADLAELGALEKQLRELSARRTARPEPAGVPASPSWIWFPEGRPAEAAPAEARFFRCTFEVPEVGVRAAELRLAADDACEVYLNGARLGANETWKQATSFALEKRLRPGRNVLAVRAENRSGPAANPAGLIAFLPVVLTNGKETAVVSDASWRTAKAASAEWPQLTFDDSAWQRAIVAAPLGKGPWGNLGGLGEAGDLGSAFADLDPAVRQLYFAVRRLKRRIAFKNPAINFSQLLFIDQPYPSGPVNDIHEAIHRMGITATPGGRLLVLSGLHPGGEIRKLAPDEPGSFWRPDLSFDGKRVLFCFKPHAGKSFHLYEMNLDGTGLHQLTDSDYDDVDPLYLPDGKILFTTTRGNSYVRCGPFIYSYTLARCDADGGNVYLISHNGEPDFVPALLNDGRVVYSRWEYTDKPLWRVQSLWTTNQNGTNTMAFWGNQSVWPDHLSEPRPIPGSQRVMFSGVGHHDWWSGSIGIVDPAKGMNYPVGLTKVTHDLRWPECSLPPEDPAESPRYHASGKFTGYKTPYPLSEKDFLVSARGEGGKFRLYLMDVDGNRELIYEGVHNVLHAIPAKPRAAPLRQPDRVAWPGTGEDRKPVKLGVLYSADVYEGVPDLPRGSAKYLRVFQMDHKTYSTWRKTWRHSGPAVSVIQEEGVKRILSEVPIEADGSVYFEAPPGKSLHFQLLDEQYRCLQTMRSFTGVMPGEERGCIGCHESHSVTPPLKQGQAFARAPTRLTPPPWGTESISYERFAQPVLDEYCGKCHQGNGEARKVLDLTLRTGHNVFKEPYLTLVGSAGWSTPVPNKGQPGYGIAGAIPVESIDPTMNDPKAYGTLRPLTMLSYRSPLVELAAGGEHHDVKVDAASLRRLMAWVDACCPFMGDKEIRALGDPDFPGIEELPIRPRVASAPVVERP